MFLQDQHDIEIDDSSHIVASQDETVEVEAESEAENDVCICPLSEIRQNYLICFCIK